MKNFLNKVFKIDENQTTIKAEIIGGLTTFFAMCYIIIVNPGQMIGFNFGVEGAQQVWNAVFVGGIISAVIATLCMAFIAKKPFALAAGMGLNSFFFVSFILPALTFGPDGAPALNGTASFKEVYGAGLVVILISGLIFMLLSITGLRKYIATSLPPCLKASIPAGIGLFIAFLGLRGAGFIVNNQFTSVAIADFTKWETAAPALVAFLGFLAIIGFSKIPVKWVKNSAIILGIAVSTGLYYAFGLKVNVTSTNLGEVFKDFAEVGLFNFNFKLAFNGEFLGSIFSVIMLIIAFTLVDMFDTVGTLYGTSAEANMLDENGDPERLNECMLCDSIGTVVGSCFGTSTITTFVESSAGVAAGARTGLASVVTALLFLVCLFLAPIAQYVPQVATAPALVYVGLLMSKNITKVDFTDLRFAAPAFLAFLLMPLTYSISNGIMIGAIAYVFITLVTGKYKKSDIVVTIIAVLSILKFIFVRM